MIERRYLLDSNILIYMIAGEPDALRERIEQKEPGALVTSTICIAEVLFGAEDRTKRLLSNLLNRILPVPFDLRAAEAFAIVPFGRGRFDRLIAAHTLALDATLVTANIRDFTDVKGLRIENWTK